MPDNVTYQNAVPATPPNGLVVATDDVGGVDYQIVKLDVGGDGVSAPLSAANPLPISGPVTGPLTDIELRANPVPVSGPLTDTELRANPVPIADGGGSITVDGSVTVAGPLAVTGPLTDAQLRASPIDAITDLTAAVLNMIDHMERPIYVDRTNASLRANVGTVTTVSGVTPLTAPATTDPLFLMFINSFRVRFSSALGDKIT